ncbi:hypothetical protein FRACA_4290004 [Frankia canadensis]|uniref:Uncharacterized protein n=1 Tax=Frankia canadensis TaxID=1836972 RepID=A0A2I2KX71_9ACTN|nr:hypothetical protein FRACA_4290004 [Frankia canadensis]SOU57547.1 hypothetical protein FRACA_4290004 [Frankia canadensis]
MAANVRTIAEDLAPLLRQIDPTAATPTTSAAQLTRDTR